MTNKTAREVIGEWGEIYRWDGGDAKAEALEEADLLIKALNDAGYVVVPATMLAVEPAPSSFGEAAPGVLKPEK